nr:hypothetical protein [Massilia sp. PDC64]
MTILDRLVRRDDVDKPACYTFPIMVRRFLYVFIAVFAFQFSWNALAAYCTHETGRAAMHFGHHEHHSTADELSVAAKDKQTTTKKLVHDAHCCSGTHLSIAAPDLLEVPNILKSAETLTSEPILAPDSAFLTPPERPQWTSRA